MSQQFKKIFSVALALVLGVGIVFVAWKGDSLTSSKISVDTETNNSWKDSLTVVSSSRTPVALLGKEYAQSGATTATDFVAQTFVENYARAQVSKGAVPLEDADIQGIVKTLSEKTLSVDTVKQYREQDFVVVPASTSTITAYKEQTIGALNEFAQKNKVNELQVVAQALDSSDASKLAELDAVIMNYQTLIDALIKVPVPRTVLAFHLSLVQGYTNMQAGIDDMREIITDPVRGMRGIAKYNNGAGLVSTAIAMLHTNK